MPTIRNVLTGQEWVCDPTAARIARLRRRVFSWVEVMRERCAEVKGSWHCMITLTYSDVYGWRKDHIRDFMLWVKRRLNERLLGYAWVAELQKRGAVHYHVILALSNGSRLPKPDKCGSWPHGMTRIEKARTLYYICKYTSKGGDNDGNDFPKHARTFGLYVDREAKRNASHHSYRTSSYPKWLVAIIDTGNFGERAWRERGGGWRIGNFVFHSPYVRVNEN